MKKKIITAILAMSCVGFSVGSAFSATALYCPAFSVEKTGTTTSGRLFTRVKNVGPLCNGLKTGATIDLFFDGDQELAILLTAFSLPANVGINALSVSSTTMATNDALASVMLSK